jgi:hypothetical protein
MAGTRIALVLALAAGAPALAQTIEERAAQVQRALGVPPPTETTIDRGTRVLGQPGTAPAAAPAQAIDPRLLGGSSTGGGSVNGTAPASATPAAGAPRPTGFMNDPRGTGFLNDSRGTGTAGARGTDMPGLTVIKPADSDQVGGTSNVVTGTGRSPGLAP